MRIPILAASALLLLGGATCEEGNEQPSERTVAIRGRITDEGDQCPTMRDRDNRLFMLAGSIDLYKPGDRVCVKGRLVEDSPCGKGTTITVEYIGPMRFCN
jgi:hypothetical protein